MEKNIYEKKHIQKKSHMEVIIHKRKYIQKNIYKRNIYGEKLTKITYKEKYI